MKSEVHKFALPYSKRFLFTTAIPVGLTFVLSLILIGTLKPLQPSGPNANPLYSFWVLGIVSSTVAMTVGGSIFCLILSSYEWTTWLTALLAGFCGIFAGLLCAPIVLFIIGGLFA